MESIEQLPRISITSIAIICAIVLFPAYARADVMLATFGLPICIILFPVIVLIEAFILRRDLKIPFKKSLNISLRGNASSTAIGWFVVSIVEAGASIPLVMLFHGSSKFEYAIRFIASGGMSGWDPKYGNLDGMLFPVAILWVVFLFLLISWRLEWRATKKRFGTEIPNLKKAWLTANCWSYAVIYLFLIVYCVVFTYRH